MDKGVVIADVCATGGGGFYLEKTFADRLSPLGRMLVTANGTLQRIVSSWTNYAVDVRVLKNHPVSSAGAPGESTCEPSASFGLVEKLEDNAVLQEHARLARGRSIRGLNVDESSESFERRVELVCEKRIFAVAESAVTIWDAKIVNAVKSNQVGIGQVFRKFDLAPHFELISAEILPGQVGEALERRCNILKRTYVLIADGLCCVICEVIDESILPAPRTTQTVLPVAAASSNGSPIRQYSLNDLTKGTHTELDLGSLEFHLRPFERVLLTANNNMQRLISSFWNCVITSKISTAARIALFNKDEAELDDVFEQGIDMLQGKRVVCKSNTKLTVKCRNLSKKLQGLLNSYITPDDVFGPPGQPGSISPSFELVGVSKNSNHVDDFVLHLSLIHI